MIIKFTAKAGTMGKLKGQRLLCTHYGPGTQQRVISSISQKNT